MSRIPACAESFEQMIVDWIDATMESGRVLHQHCHGRSFSGYCKTGVIYEAGIAFNAQSSRMRFGGISVFLSVAFDGG
jgi:hypothetical protein